MQLWHLFDHVRDAVVVGEASSGRIVLWNDAAEALFGYTREEAFDLLIEDLVPPELKAQHRHGIARFARDGTGMLVDAKVPVELPALRKDGTTRILQFTLTPIESYELEGRFVLAILRDVTARRQLQRETEEGGDAVRAALAREQEATRQLRRVDELRAIFVAMVAHDVRSPMAVVQGFAEHLLSDWDEISLEERTSALEAIVRSAGRVVRLSEDVLLVDSLESGEVPLTLEFVRVEDAVRDACEPLEAIDEAPRFKRTLEPQLSVMADPHRLWQVLTNLLSNAVRHSPADRPIEIEAHRRGAVVEINLRDYGPGISAEFRETVFERYRQLETPGARAASGTGLGLYISRQLLVLMGGDISISETQGSGSTFTIHLAAAVSGS